MEDKSPIGSQHLIQTRLSLAGQCSLKVSPFHSRFAFLSLIDAISSLRMVGTIKPIFEIKKFVNRDLFKNNHKTKVGNNLNR